MNINNEISTAITVATRFAKQEVNFRSAFQAVCNARAQAFTDAFTAEEIELIKSVEDLFCIKENCYGVDAAAKYLRNLAE